MPDMIAESDLLMYINAARSMAAIAGVCNGGTTDHGCLAAARDQTTINALISLHESCYDTGRALQEFIKNPLPLVVDKKWSEDETKKFVRGLKQYGKNFFKIRKEFLPHKETCDLVEFYYVWKKTEAANSQRPRQRQRRPPTNILRVKKSKTTNASKQNNNNKQNLNEFLDLSSASENELEDDGGESSKDFSIYACHHCFSTKSKNWHHGGKDKIMLCTDCRVYCKKFGDLPLLERSFTPPSFLLKSSTKDNEDGGVKTRRSNNSNKDQQQRKPDSPSAASVSSNNSEETTNAKIQKPVKKGKKRKSDQLDDLDDYASLAKHKSSSNNKKQSTDDVLSSENSKNNEMSSSDNDNSTDSTSSSSSNSSPAAVDNSNVVDKREIPFKFRENDEQIVDSSSSLKDSTNSVIVQKTNVVVDVDKTRKVKEELCDDGDVQMENERDVNSMTIIKDPEPKLDDAEHYRSKNAIFRRHWYRGEFNSCSRTDLVFVPKPDSALARNRERRLKCQPDQIELNIKQEPNTSSSWSRPTSQVNPPLPSPQQGSAATNFVSPATAQTYATPGPPSLTPVITSTAAVTTRETPALQKLKEYAALSTATPSGVPPPLHPFYPPNCPPGVDPVLQSRILSGAFGTYEKERLEFELRERRKEEIQGSLFQQNQLLNNYPFLSLAPPQSLLPNVDPRSWMAAATMASRNGAFPSPSPMIAGLSPNSSSIPPLIQTAAAAGNNVTVDPATAERVLNALSAERVHLERLFAANPSPLVRLELEKVTAQMTAVAGTQHHTHSHTHSHTHLHIHPTTGIPMLTTDDGGISWPAHLPPVPPDPFNPYASVFRPTPGLDSPCGFGAVPQIGLEHLAAERLQQVILHQQELQRRMIMMERDHFLAGQHQSIVQHNEMMRRLHEEGNFFQRPTAVPLAPTNDAPPLPPFDKR